MEKDEDGYCLKPDIVPVGYEGDESYEFYCQWECGLVLDKDGNILVGKGEDETAVDDRIYGNWVGDDLYLLVDSFGGDNADVAYFCNPYHNSIWDR